MLAAFCAASAGAEEVMTLQWEAGVIAITPADLAEARVTPDGMVTVRLEAELAGKFADLSELLIGETIAILLCGRELTRPEVRERIDSGVIAFPAGERAQDVPPVLTGAAPCTGFWEK